MLKIKTNIWVSIAFIFWTVLIFFCYEDNFSFPGNHENFVLDEILIGIVLISIALFSGNRLFRFFRLRNVTILEESLFSVGIGLGLLSISIFILGLLKLLFPWTMVVLLIGFSILAAGNYTFGKILWIKAKNRHPNFSLPELFIIFLIIMFTGITLINTLTPPVSRDALIHHLAIPKWYVNHHGIVDVPFSTPSYYPPFMEMLYTGALLLSSDILAKLLHFFFFLGSLLFTYALGKRSLSRFMSLLAVLLVGSLPVVCQVSSIAYSDLGLTFYSLGGFVALFRWFQTRLKGWFYLGALMTGCAVSCKYNGLIILFSFVMGILLIHAQWRVSLKFLIKNMLLFFLLVFMVNALWLSRNYLFTGNPVYPLASSFIGQPWFPQQPKLSQYQVRNMLYEETLWDQILLPWNLSIKTKSISRHELDGVINPIFLIFLPFFLFLPRKSKGIKWIACFCLLYFLFFWASSRVRLRYLMPIYPMLGIMTAYVVAHWEIKWKKLLVSIPLCLFFILNLYWLFVYTSTINPINYLVGKESRQEFLNRNIPSYPVFEYINTHLPQDVRVMFLYGGKHGSDGYYLDCDYYYDTRYLGYTAKEILKKADTPEDMRKEFLRLRITHFLINWKRLQLDFSSSLSREKNKLFKKFCQSYLNLEFKHKGSSLYYLVP